MHCLLRFLHNLHWQTIAIITITLVLRQLYYDAPITTCNVCLLLFLPNTFLRLTRWRYSDSLRFRDSDQFEGFNEPAWSRDTHDKNGRSNKWVSGIDCALIRTHVAPFGIEIDSWFIFTAQAIRILQMISFVARIAYTRSNLPCTRHFAKTIRYRTVHILYASAWMHLYLIF